MTRRVLIVLLTISLFMNFYLYNKDDSLKRHEASTVIALASTYEILFDEIESVSIYYNAYLSNEITDDEFADKISKSLIMVSRVNDLLDSYEFIPVENSLVYSDLEMYLYNIGRYSSEENIEVLRELVNISNENSSLTVAQFYKDYPDLLRGKLPENIIKMANDYKNALSRLDM